MKDDVASAIDHTFLKPAGGRDAVRRLCESQGAITKW